MQNKAEHNIKRKVGGWGVGRSGRTSKRRADGSNEMILKDDRETSRKNWWEEQQTGDRWIRKWARNRLQMQTKALWGKIRGGADYLGQGVPAWVHDITV